MGREPAARSGRRGRARPALAAISLLAVCLAPAPAGARSIVLQRFDAEIVVEPAGDVRVVETLDLRFEGSWNGIVRSIPVEYRTPGGLNHSLLLDVVAVTDAHGRRLRRELSRRAHHREIRIWISGAADAERTVVLHYRVRNALRFLDTHDELYWNVTGDEWEFPIAAASATVVLPEAATGTRATAFTGAYGSRGQDAGVRVAGNAVRVVAGRTLGFREGLTVVVGWDKGAVREPGPLRRAGFFARANWPLAIPLVVLAGMTALWSRRGRDPARRPVAVRYEPPEALTPAEAGTLVDHTPDLRDITATIVDLAVRGHLVIEEEERPEGLRGWLSKADYTFRRTGTAEDLRAHDRAILEALFRGGSVTRLSALEHVFYKDLPRIRDGIYDALIGHRCYDHRPDRTKRGAFLAGGLVGGVGLGLAEGLSGWSGLAPLTFQLAAGLSGAVIAAFGWLLPARTIRGTRVLEDVLGFQRFLDRVESDRLERVPPTPETFERYLPWAMALGVEQNWARAFEGIVREPPKWYRGGGGRGPFRASGFADDLGSLSTRAGAVLASAPRSSGGSGFGRGGFSGGGFGGGGGRGF